MVRVRLGVLDVGSNTVHLLVVDARRGGHPTPTSSTKAALRLAESIDSSGKLTRKGADKLVDTVTEFASIATSSGCAVVARSYYRPTACNRNTAATR